eukprot:6972566-Alexandrium_andersonii.AAC.1
MDFLLGSCPAEELEAAPGAGSHASFSRALVTSAGGGWAGGRGAMRPPSRAPMGCCLGFAALRMGLGPSRGGVCGA